MNRSTDRHVLTDHEDNRLTHRLWPGRGIHGNHVADQSGHNRATPTARPHASTAEITISQFTFSEASATPGATVTVRNLDDTEHTVTSSGVFDTGAIASASTTSIVAPTAVGVYEFVCDIHPTMRGRLAVTAP